ncbi:germin-like protein 12-2 isoform X5 [Citrus sinensis]|uniref:germin-like protein 12-2 isoform X5 n=1 Tax=Citrus sinensis TaxID=2711 RepID=UPI0022791F3C|nr:germin-like protein 12-2 isoform X5 [Citrus sinensis]
MKAIQFLIGFALLALASSLASASDPSPLQDICVAINDPKDGGNVHVSKYICLLLRDYGIEIYTQGEIDKVKCEWPTCIHSNLLLHKHMVDKFNIAKGGEIRLQLKT